VTEYYYGSDDNRSHNLYTYSSKSSLQNHLQTHDGNYGRTYNKGKIIIYQISSNTFFYFQIDDDVLSVNSARSLSSSTNLALQTLERAQQNKNKYWSDQSPNSLSSPKKPYSDTH
jgi:hypothetical protein